MVRRTLCLVPLWLCASSGGLCSSSANGWDRLWEDGEDQRHHQVVQERDLWDYVSFSYLCIYVCTVFVFLLYLYFYCICVCTCKSIKKGHHQVYSSQRDLWADILWFLCTILVWYFCVYLCFYLHMHLYLNVYLYLYLYFFFRPLQVFELVHVSLKGTTEGNILIFILKHSKKI